MPFVKLDTGILNSTLWIDREGREVFITALLLAQPLEVDEPMATFEVRSVSKDDFEVPPGWYGFVPAASTGIIRHAMVPIEAGMEALERLSKPDKESRTPDFEGRRMVRVDGGFIILNYMKYRDKDHTAADRQRRLRERRKRSPSRRDVTLRSVTVTHSREQMADSDADKIEHQVRVIAKLHPALSHKTEPSRIEIEEICKAIIRDGEELVLAGTKNLADAVAKWPAAEKKFIPNAVRFYQNSDYLKDPAMWERGGNKRESNLAVLERLEREEAATAGE